MLDIIKRPNPEKRREKSDDIKKKKLKRAISEAKFQVQEQNNMKKLSDHEEQLRQQYGKYLSGEPADLSNLLLPDSPDSPPGPIKSPNEEP
eukprot:UN04248